MDLFTLTDAGRELAEFLMVDTVEIRGPATGATFDEATGKLTGGSPGPVLYSGPARRVSAKRFAQQANSGGREYVETREELHLPMSAPHITAGAVAVLTAAPKDPNAVGQRMYVTGPSSGSLTTAQRLRVTEVVG